MTSRLWNIRAILAPVRARADGLFLLFFVALALPSAVFAARDTPTLCEDASRNAANRTGVPLPVLQAIALAETGRRSDEHLRPWPWTVNIQGAGHWFETATEALTFASGYLGQGSTSFDVGCFQINYRWHGENFVSLDRMFDPTENALYAARFLASLYDETGGWPEAAAAYHSRTPVHGERYRKRFEALFAALTGEAATAPLRHAVVGAEPPRMNDFPLLRGGTGGGLGSLVPAQAGRRPLIGQES